MKNGYISLDRDLLRANEVRASGTVQADPQVKSSRIFALQTLTAKVQYDRYAILRDKLFLLLPMIYLCRKDLYISNHCILVICSLSSLLHNPHTSPALQRYSD
jgi:hypothetical protein